MLIAVLSVTFKLAISGAHKVLISASVPKFIYTSFQFTWANFMI